jgi:hypothetical protein
MTFSDLDLNAQGDLVADYARTWHLPLAAVASAFLELNPIVQNFGSYYVIAAPRTAHKVQEAACMNV